MSTFTCIHDALDDAMHVQIEDAVAWVRNGGARGSRLVRTYFRALHTCIVSVTVHWRVQGGDRTVLMLGLVRRLSL